MSFRQFESVESFANERLSVESITDERLNVELFADERLNTVRPHDVPHPFVPSGNRFLASVLTCFGLLFLLDWGGSAAGDEPTVLSLPVPMISAPATAENVSVNLNEEMRLLYEPPGPNEALGNPGLDVDESQVELVVLLPSEPVLVDLHITVDGQPFRERRQNNIERLSTLSNRSPMSGSNAALQNDHAKDAVDSLVNIPHAKRLSDYMVATGRRPGPQEIEWLLTQWSGGSEILSLRESFAIDLAQNAPLFDALDINRDAALDAEELQQATAILEDQYDHNRDGVITVSELMQPDVAGSWRCWDPRPIWFFREQFSSLRERVEQVYGRQVALPQSSQIGVRIQFDTRQPANSRLEIVSLAQGLTIRSSEFESAVEIDLAGGTLSISAVQANGSAEIDQLSVGARIAREPLFTLVNLDADDRLTARERQTMTDRLLRLDRDHNGELSETEIPQITRLCLGWGPIVHRSLNLARSYRNTESTQTEGAPEWFLSMDSNRDFDLSRREFVGGDPVFQSLDRNRDGLISLDEARGDDLSQEKSTGNEVAPSQNEAPNDE